MKQTLKFMSIIILMIIMIVFPNECKEGTNNGLVLWYNSILPSLLPYMILTNILINTEYFQNTDSSDKFLSKNTILSIFIGFFCGYPMGAYFVSKLYSSGKMTKSVAYWLISFVNLSSPAYLIQYVCIENLNGHYLKEILISVYVSAIVLCIITLPVLKKRSKFDTESMPKADKKNTKDISECILDAFFQAIKLCGYIVLFSITVKMVTANINTVTISHILVVGILEQTNGINLCSEIMGSSILSVLLVCAFTSFGSVSCIFQTAAVCKNSNLKISYYICTKILYAIICVSILYVII